MATASRRPGLGTLVLIGFALGILCGLFFGEMAAVLQPVGRAYVRLLQMAIIPYITVSLIAGLGRLPPQQASRIALWGGLVLLLILTTGMVLVLLAPLPLERYPLFATVGLFVSFGGSNIALPFLLDLFRLPADMFELFLVANVITNFFFMALSAMNLVVLTLLALFLIKGRITPKPIRLVILAGLLVIGAPVLLKASGVAMDRFISFEYRGYDKFISRGLINTGVKVRSVDYQAELPAALEPPARLQRIQSSGWLRVGYSSDSLPWAFSNSHGDIVGFDMELMHRLARELDVGIEILLIERSQIGHALDSGQIDIYASGLLIDASRVREFGFSLPYREITLGLLVEDHKREMFETNEQLEKATDTKLAVLNSPSLLRALEVFSAGRELVPIDSPRGFWT